MKAKLIKKKDGWYNLYQDNIGIGSTHSELQGYKLSLKNCQAIERGYNLDELLDDYIIRRPSVRIDKKHQKMFKEGFQKALEILGDKKFSINEVVELCKILISNPYEKSGKTPQELVDSYIHSLQQTEWDVEVVMEDVFIKNNDQYVDEIGIGNYSTHSKRPKLDDDGCLILKIINL